MCCAHDIIEAKNTARVARTVIMLINYNQLMHQHQIEQIGQSMGGLTTIGSVMGHPPTSLSNQTQQAQQQQTAV